MFFCHNCGAQLRDNALFCHVCGAEQIVDEISGAAPAEPAVKVAQIDDSVPDRHPIEPEPIAHVSAEPSGTRAPEPEKAEAPQVQIPLPTGSYTWENVKISGEFKNGVGTITITFS